MPSIIVNVGNIGTFAFKTTLNLQSRQIVFDCTASTFQGAGAGATKGIAFSLIDQAGVVLLAINWSAPQIPSPGTSLVYIYDASGIDFGFLFQTYQIVGAIQDANGSIYSTQPILANICQPTGFCESGYVPGMFELRADCNDNLLTVKEVSLLVYNGLSPYVAPSVSGTLYYPTGTIASVPFTSTPFTNNVVYTGQYAINNTTQAIYQLPNDVYVTISYVTASQWNFTCTNKIADLLCCISDLYKTKAENCGNAIGKRAADQLAAIEVPFFVGLAQEMNGQDASWAYEIIKKQLNCNCGQNALGQNQMTPVNPSVYNIVVTGVGGTQVNPSTSGNTKTYQVQSNVFQVSKGNPSDPGLIVGPAVQTGYTTQWPITLNYLPIAQAIYTATAGDPATLQQLNNLIQSIGIDLSGLNGECIINLNTATYTANQVTTNATTVLSVVINGTTYNAPTGLLANNTSAFASWLNSLTLGTFSVTLQSGTVSIVTQNNSNTLSTISFSDPAVTVQFIRTSYTLTQILQAIISYICDLSALQIELGAALSLQYINYNGQTVTQNFSATNNTQNDFNQAISTSISSIITKMNSLVGATCATLLTIFQSYPNTTWTSNSTAFGNDGNGNCIAWSDLQLATMVMNAVGKYSSVKALFCSISCTSPGTCPAISGINAAPSGTTSISFFGLTWATTPTANQIVSLAIRRTGTTSWTSLSTSINIFPNGNISGTPNPYPITGLTPATSYDIGVTNNCGGIQFIISVTTNSSTTYSGSYLLDNVLYSICGDSPTTLYSSAPFGTGVTLYTNIGLTTPVTGFTLVAPVSSGQIYNISSTSGLVGSNTGSSCSTGTAGTYILGNSTATICSGIPQTLYTNGPFGVGGVLYQDSALTTPVTGNSYVVQISTQTIYNLNNATGVIVSSTGLSCIATVNLHDESSATSFTSVVINSISIAVPGGFPTAHGANLNGTSGQIGTYSVQVGWSTVDASICITITGSDGSSQSQSITASSGTHTFAGVVVNNTSPVQIVVTAGTCP